MDIILIMIVALAAMLPLYVWGTILDFKYRCLPVYMCDVIASVISIAAWGFFTYITLAGNTAGNLLPFYMYVLISIGIPLLFLKFDLCGRGDVKMITPILAVSYVCAFDVLVFLLIASFVCMLLKPEWFFHKEKNVSDHEKAPFMLIITVALVTQIVFLIFSYVG